MSFRDRTDAGLRLAAAVMEEAGLAGRGGRAATLDLGDAVVLGMARGGMPVAVEVARVLAAPLDVLVVRKLGHPRQSELALGAIGEGGVRVVNEELVERLDIDQATLDALAEREKLELERRLRAYRGSRPAVEVSGRSAVVVDDGLATGATARAAVAVVRARGARQVVVAVPVAPPAAVSALRPAVDAVVCAEITGSFGGLSQWYEDFHQVSDDEVRAVLDAYRALGPGQ